MKSTLEAILARIKPYTQPTLLVVKRWPFHIKAIIDI